MRQGARLTGVVALFFSLLNGGVSSGQTPTPFPYLEEDSFLQCAPGQIKFYDACYDTLRLFGQRGAPGDFRSAHNDDIETTMSAMFGGAGVRVLRRQAFPDIVYVADVGHSRILVYGAIGSCSATSWIECTDDRNCPFGETCEVDLQRGPDLIIGSTNGCCNNDCNLGMLKAPDRTTLCLFDYPNIVNRLERWQKLNFDVDQHGNLYVPDVFNNRVLKYNIPIDPTGHLGVGDGIADAVWGQLNFTSNGVNQGNEELCSSTSLNFAFEKNVNHVGVGHRAAFAGVSVEHDSNGDPKWLWVGDVFNHRVLRFFAAGSSAATMVLGQPAKRCVSDGNACKSNADCAEADCDSVTDMFASCDSHCNLNHDPDTDLLCGPIDVRVAPNIGGGVPELWVLNQDQNINGQAIGFLTRFMMFRHAQPTDTVPGCTASPCWTHDRTRVMFSGYKTDECDRANSPDDCACSLPTNAGDCFQGSQGCLFKATGFTFNPEFKPNGPNPESQGFVWIPDHDAERVTLATRLTDPNCDNDVVSAVNSRAPKNGTGPFIDVNPVLF
jgi:hypothetical protein